MALKSFNARHGLTVGNTQIPIFTDQGTYIGGNRLRFSTYQLAPTNEPEIGLFTQTWNSAPTEFTGIKVDVVDTASQSTSKLLDLQVGSVSKVSVSKTGNLVTSGNINGVVMYSSDTGFVLSGGTSSKTLTLDADFTSSSITVEVGSKVSKGRAYFSGQF